MDALNAWIRRADAFLQRYPELPAGLDPGEDMAPMEQEANQLIDAWKAFPRNAADIVTFDVLLRIGVKVSQVFLRYQVYVQRLLQAHPPGGREPQPVQPQGMAAFGNFLGRAPGVGRAFENEALGRQPAFPPQQPAFPPQQPVLQRAEDKPFIQSGGRRKKTLRRRRRSSRR